jgi:hypothetical protein
MIDVGIILINGTSMAPDLILSGGRAKTGANIKV